MTPLSNRTLALSAVGTSTIGDVHKFLKQGGTVRHSDKRGLHIHGRFSASKLDFLAFFGNEGAKATLRDRRANGRTEMEHTLIKLFGQDDGKRFYKEIFPTDAGKISSAGLKNSGLGELSYYLKDCATRVCDKLRTEHGVEETQQTWKIIEASMVRAASKLPPEKWDKENIARVMIGAGIVETFRQQVLQNADRKGMALNDKSYHLFDTYVEKYFSDEKWDPKIFYDAGKIFHAYRTDTDVITFPKKLAEAAAKTLPFDKASDEFIELLGLKSKGANPKTFLRENPTEKLPGFNGWLAFVGHAETNVLDKIDFAAKKFSGVDAFSESMKAIFGNSTPSDLDNETLQNEVGKLSDEFCKLLAAAHNAIDSSFSDHACDEIDGVHRKLDSQFALRIIVPRLTTAGIAKGETGTMIDKNTPYARWGGAPGLRGGASELQTSLTVSHEGEFIKPGPWTKPYYQFMEFARQRGDELLKAEASQDLAATE